MCDGKSTAYEKQGIGKEVCTAGVVGILGAMASVGAIWACGAGVMRWGGPGYGPLGLLVNPAILWLVSYLGGRWLRTRMGRAWRVAKVVLATPATYAVLLFLVTAADDWADLLPALCVSGVALGPALVLTFLGMRNASGCGYTSQPDRCRRCGYDLTGNVSGRCPECGTIISAAPKVSEGPLHGDSS